MKKMITQIPRKAKTLIRDSRTGISNSDQFHSGKDQLTYSSWMKKKSWSLLMSWSAAAYIRTFEKSNTLVKPHIRPNLNTQPLLPKFHWEKDELVLLPTATTSCQGYRWLPLSLKYLRSKPMVGCRQACQYKLTIERIEKGLVFFEDWFLATRRSEVQRNYQNRSVNAAPYYADGAILTLRTPARRLFRKNNQKSKGWS